MLDNNFLCLSFRNADIIITEERTALVTLKMKYNRLPIISHSNKEITLNIFTEIYRYIFNPTLLLTIILLVHKE